MHAYTLGLLTIHTCTHTRRGYFAYMAITSFDGMQFWDRMMLVFTDKKHYPALVAAVGACDW